MLVWWSNIDVVDKFHKWMQILIVVFLILAAAATYLNKIATDRVSELKAVEESKLIKRLGIAENDAQELRKDLENTKKEHEATEKALREELEATKSEAEMARRSANRAEERLRPRALSSEQREKLLVSLRSSPKGPLEISCILGDDESFSFAKELDSIFNAAGWETNGVKRSVFKGNIVGVKVLVHSPETAPTYAVALLKALRVIGLSPDGEANESYPPHTLTVIVGHKPEH